jgi:hypothetical protein
MLAAMVLWTAFVIGGLYSLFNLHSVHTGGKVTLLLIGGIAVLYALKMILGKFIDQESSKE